MWWALNELFLKLVQLKGGHFILRWYMWSDFFFPFSSNADSLQISGPHLCSGSSPWWCTQSVPLWHRSASPPKLRVWPLRFYLKPETNNKLTDMCKGGRRANEHLFYIKWKAKVALLWTVTSSWNISDLCCVFLSFPVSTMAPLEKRKGFLRWKLKVMNAVVAVVYPPHLQKLRSFIFIVTQRQM